MTEYRDCFYHSHDGLRLYARDYPCAADDSRGVVLCMHGLTRNSADFHELACHLQARYRVLSVDQRGRGRSDYDTNPANYDVAVYVQDMFTLMETLSVSQVIAVGTSMGGLITMVMAAMQPERLRGAVLNDIGPEIDPAGLARIKSYVGKSAPVSTWEEAIAQSRAINAVAFPDFTEQQWSAFTRGLYREEGGKPVLAYDPAIAAPMEAQPEAVAPPDLWSVYEGMAALPLLVVRGASSDILAPGCVERMSAIKPDLHCCEVPNRGHAPTLDEPVARQAIDRFLSGLAPAGV